MKNSFVHFSDDFNLILFEREFVIVVKFVFCIDWLKDGTILCALMDILQPGVCKKPHDVSKIRLQVNNFLGVQPFPPDNAFIPFSTFYQNF